MNRIVSKIKAAIREMDWCDAKTGIDLALDIESLHPYDPCWCKSGLKFFDCHLNRDKQKQVTQGEFEKAARDIFESKKYCCATFDKANCKLPIKKAHTIQRSKVLSDFAHNGHVGTFYQNVSGLKEKGIQSGIRKKASIFYGFCEYHDTELFKNIELYDFENTSENCWASSYRAVCHEYYQKVAAIKCIQWEIANIDKGCSLREQILIQYYYRKLKQDIEKGLKFINLIKSTFEYAKLKKKYKLINSYIIRLDSHLVLATCGMISPYYNVSGNLFQNPVSYNLEHIAISTVKIDDKATYILSYLKKHNRIETYLKEVLAKDKNYIKNWLFKCIFAYLENVFFDLKWWDCLDPTYQDKIYELAISENYTKSFDFDDLVGKHVPGEIINIQSG